MWAGLLAHAWPAIERWVWPEMVVCLAGATWLTRRKSRAQETRQKHKAKVYQELEAYTQLDTRVPPDGDLNNLARRISCIMAEKSAFTRTAMLICQPGNRLLVAASKGLDSQASEALDAWCESMSAVPPDGHKRGFNSGIGIRLTHKSFAVVLGKDAIENGCGRAVVTPMWSTSGRLLGALVVCADGLLSVCRSTVIEAMAGIEALAAKLARSMENAMLVEQLLKAEKLAGLGLLAGGVGHALNNPLTSVLGFAELIAHTTSEPRVREDAETIRHEALRMRETVESLANYWQPIADSDQIVEIPALLEFLSIACAEKLARRGIKLVVETADTLPVVRGNKERLRQVLEHLLNNAAQAVGEAQDLGVVSPLDGAEEEHSIRVTVNCDERMLHLIVSDTGPGFREPARIFDPFYVGADTDVSGGAKVGLSLCHGIVHEHGGEITAFNLQPHGAAVLVNLPVNRMIDATREVA